MSPVQRIQKWLVVYSCLVPIAAGSTANAESAETNPADRPEGRLVRNGPDGYEMVGYLDCGTATENAAGAGPHLRILNGKAIDWPGARPYGSIGTAAADDLEVVCEIRGFKVAAEYVLGFTWWDFDRKGRVQSVRFGSGQPVKWTTVLSAGPAVTWYEDKPTWAQIHLPVPAEFRRGDRLRVSFHREGPAGAVVSDVWLMEKRPGGADALSAARKRIAIITGDDYPGHLWRLTAPEIAAILREDLRLEVTITESPMMLASPLLAGYDAVVLHYMNWKGRPDPGETVWNGLQQYVESGKGLVLVHFACGAFQSWSGFVKVAGRVWDPNLRGHDPYGPFEVRVSDRLHLITAEMDDFKTTDELYTCLVGNAPVRLLAEATSVVDKKVHPMGFVHEPGKGRVFHTPLGHDLAAYRSPGTRALVRRATAWAAGLQPR